MFFLFFKVQIHSSSSNVSSVSSFTTGRILVANMFLYNVSMYVTQCVVCEL